MITVCIIKLSFALAYEDRKVLPSLLGIFKQWFKTLLNLGTSGANQHSFTTQNKANWIRYINYKSIFILYTQMGLF